MKSSKYIIGVDEAGRGPLAGPVCVGLVMVPVNFDFGIFPHLDDSKRMTEKRRQVIMNQLENTNLGSLKTTAVFGSAADIDKKGIKVVIEQAIAEGLEKLEVDAGTCQVYLDGALLAPEKFSQETIIGGDGKLAVISLASVVAKETRDTYMREISQQYPVFNFSQHKGYGTKDHRAAIKEHGLSDLHRKTFCTNLID